MIAYKFTRPGGSTHNGFRWPLPSADGPGEWVEIGKRARRALTMHDLCTSRVFHATDAAHLISWADAELYEVEIDEGRGLIVGSDKIGFRRGRLVRRIEAWNEGTAQAAWDAAWAVARAAAWDAPRGAPRAAAWAAAWDAARAKYGRWLCDQLGIAT